MIDRFRSLIKRFACGHLVRCGAVCVFLGAAIACASPSAEDKARLKQLESSYGEQLTFGIEGDLYLRVTQRTPTPVSEQQLRAVYELFVFDRGARRATSIVYLNYYDANGRFQYQLFYDPKKQRIKRDDRSEYY